jgi:iron complex transport system permease protein
MSATELMSPAPSPGSTAAVALNEEPDRPQLPGGRVAHVTRTRRTAGVFLLLVTVGFGIVLSLAIGSKAIAFDTVVRSFTDFDATLTDHLIIRELRLPRTVLAVMVGAALGVAGALMQGVTRNPLADPGLLGVNAGASFAVVLAIWAFSITDVFGLVWFAFIGAALTSVLVYALGSMGRGGANPVRLALAGAALSAMLGAFTGAVTLLDQATLDQYRFWAVGSLAGRDAGVTAQLVPFVAVGLLIAFGAGRQLNALALGEEAARSLGTKVNMTRFVSAIGITLLCGSAVAACGPIAFVGLVVPHMMRVWFGPDQRWLMPASALAGAGMLLYCDTAGRVVARPGEIQVGIMTAAIGGPVFVFLVRRTRMAQL